MERMGCCGNPIGFGHDAHCEDADPDFEKWRDQQDRLAAEYEAYLEDADGGRMYG